MIDPEVGFTSSVIREPERFVGRTNLLKAASRAINARSSLVAVSGKRGVGKSSLLRQIQLMATGDYEILTKAGLHHLIPGDPRRYYTVFYTCDSSISNIEDLLMRICTDNDDEDGLLRLLPDKGKELVEFSRSSHSELSADLKVSKWGRKGERVEKYAPNIQADIIQTFRNFCSSVMQNNNSIWKRRDGLLICVDEFDVITDKTGIGSLIKSLTSDKLKFAISGISDDIAELVSDHESVERLIEQGYAHVKPMSFDEAQKVFETATVLFDGRFHFEKAIVEKIFEVSLGYPYLIQLIGKSIVEELIVVGKDVVDHHVYERVLAKIADGTAFPVLERKYQRAVGDSEDRALLLTLLAEEKIQAEGVDSGISLKSVRTTAQELEINHMDQLVPRLIDRKFGPALVKKEDLRGTYEFLDPVFRAYVRLRGKSTPATP